MGRLDAVTLLLTTKSVKLLANVRFGSITDIDIKSQIVVCCHVLFLVDRRSMMQQWADFLDTLGSCGKVIKAKFGS